MSMTAPHPATRHGVESKGNVIACRALFFQVFVVVVVVVVVIAFVHLCVWVRICMYVCMCALFSLRILFDFAYNMLRVNACERVFILVLVCYLCIILLILI